MVRSAMDTDTKFGLAEFFDAAAETGNGRHIAAEVSLAIYKLCCRSSLMLHLDSCSHTAIGISDALRSNQKSNTLGVPE